MHSLQQGPSHHPTPTVFVLNPGMHFGLTVVRVPEEDHRRDGLSSYVGR